jgi:hypothetical protein
LILILFLATPGAFAGTVSLGWDAPTTNEDGTPLTDLAGYTVYYGTSSGVYTQLEDAGTATTYDVTNLTAGTTYYFVVTARDYSGNESTFSTEESTTVAATPVPDILVTDSVAPSDDLQLPFGSVTQGSSADQTVTVTNDGNADLVISSVAQNDPLGSPFSVQGDTCTGQTLAPAASCSITVRFAPVTTGTQSDTFDIGSNDPDEGFVSVSVSGSGTSAPTPDITVTDSVAPTTDLQLPFGSVTEGNSADQTATVTNDGNADLTITSVAQNDPLGVPFSVQSDTCTGQTLVPAASCSVTVRFAPSTTGVWSDTFEIASSDPDENSVTFTVTGTGDAAPAPDIAVTDSVAPTTDRQLPFGSVTEGSSKAETVAVSNNGNADLVIGSVAGSDALSAPFTIEADACTGQTLAPAAGCSITVRFAPSTTGAWSDSFHIASNDPDSSSVTVNVSGTGAATPVPDITVTDSVSPAGDHQVAFGTLTAGNSSLQQVTVTNDGTAGLIMGSVAASDPLNAPFSIQTDTCSGTTLAPSGSCSMQVLFAPSTEGVFNDSFGIPSNDPDEGLITVSVSGSGLPAYTNNPPSQAILVSPANGQQGLGPDLTFIWEPSTDPDGDPVSYELHVSDSSSFTGSLVIHVAGVQREGVKYAAAGGQLAGLFLAGIAFAGGLGRRRMIALLVVLMVFAGMLLASCGGGGSGFSLSGGGTPDNALSQYVSGLQPGTTYHWKVVAYDDQGASSESETRTFSTQ